MSVQQNPFQYAECIQYQLASIVSPVPVYAAFNRNWATQQKFVTWQLRNVHQPVYTGQNQANKGIDRPIYQTSIFTQDMQDGFNIANTILQSLHGYSGEFGGLIYVAKVDVTWLYNTYDDKVRLHQIILDTTLDIPC